MKEKLSDIAERIQKHLTRFEKDPAINKGDKFGSLYYCARAMARGSRIFVTYISYHGSASLSRDEALEYLAWLDAGNVGKLWEMQKGPLTK